MGMLADKAYTEVLDIIMPYAVEFITLTPNSNRALSAEKLAETIRSLGGKATAADNAKEAIRIAYDTGMPTVAFGSLYMAGDIRNEFCYTNEK